MSKLASFQQRIESIVDTITQERSCDINMSGGGVFSLAKPVLRSMTLVLTNGASLRMPTILKKDRPQFADFVSCVKAHAGTCSLDKCQSSHASLLSFERLVTYMLAALAYLWAALSNTCKHSWLSTVVS